MYTLIDSIGHWLPFTLLVFLRLSAMLLVMPVLGYATVAPRIRIALAVVITMIIAPVVGETFHTVYTSLLMLAVDGIREVFIGLLIGFGAKILFEAFRLAGSLVGFQMGLAIMNVADPTSQDNVSIIGNLWFLVIVLFFLLTDSHHFLIETLFASFKGIPIGRASVDPAAGQVLVREGGHLFELSIRFAAPMILFLLLSDVAIAFAARVMPQLNIFFISMPLKIGAGIYMVLVSLKIFQSIFGQFEQSIEQTVYNLMVGIKGAL
ncbi:MAG: flagellar biosynthetic protein FliR [Calditrichaeota bacterium]|nr:MAG: flagellar biosynthetic protein FliR [Calditrichota bacterium]